MAAKKILMLVGDFSEDYEVMVPFQALSMICHAAQILAAAGVLKGRSCSSYPAVGPDVTACGGKYQELPIDKAFVDGNLISAPAWPAHPDWLAKFLKVLGTKVEL